MDPLLSIKRIDAQIELQIQPARLELSTQDPSHRITREQGGLRIETRAPKVRIDTFEARCSMGFKTPARLAQESTDKNLQIALEATAQIVRDGNRLADPLSGASPAVLAQERVFAGIAAANNTVIGAIPSVPAEITVEPGSISMEYEPDELEFEWQTSTRPALEFVPASIEFRIKERPRLEIEFLGKPIYVPPSASPDYEPKFSKSV